MSIRLNSAVLTLAVFPSVLVCGGEVVIDFTSGRVRVQGLSPTLVRVEPEGPCGFENRTTFAVAGRSEFGAGEAVQTLNATDSEAFVATSDYTIHITASENTDVPIFDSFGTCQCQEGTDVSDPVRSANYGGGTKVDSNNDCCNACESDPTCLAWVFAGGNAASNTTLGDNVNDVPDANCWPLSGFSATHGASDRCVGCTQPGCAGAKPILADVVVTRNSDAQPVWQLSKATENDNYLGNLNWPAPGSGSSAYAFEDRPRFFVPEWGPTPIPTSAKVDPELIPTNGYDFRNDVAGDLYVFLFPASNGIDAWHSSRQEFLRLTGSVPLLPDWAYGTWFTYWHQYHETEAKGEILRWEADDLPLDVWALDMNWRNTPHGHQDNPPFVKGEQYLYNKPNTELFPDFANNGTAWFDWLQQKGLRTYFNDHPFPADDGKAFQTTDDEVNFRWDGLSHWLNKGLTFWWFDANWAFSIPPPQVPYGGSGDGPAWEGMTNRVWGSHVYYTTSRVYNENNPVRNHTAPAEAPLALTKYADDNMHPGLVQHQHVAHHRYPVWWTGDGVDLQASVQSMVDSGVYDLKPFVHSDCGGDYRGKVGGDLVRWAAHCTFGTILRFHGQAHQPWSYDNQTEDSIRVYLKMRYKLLPSLIAAGHTATVTGFPLVVRGDILYPDQANSGASSNEQYLHLNDTLVAPIWDSSHNETTRDVWIPPGEWQDAWSGDRVQGPKNMTTTQPYERIPMWHRVESVIVTSSQDSALRVEDQDWTKLTVDAFVPSLKNTDGKEKLSTRLVYKQRANEPSFSITFIHSSPASFKIQVTPLSAAITSTEEQQWVVRLHLPQGQSVNAAIVDGTTVNIANIQLEPLNDSESYNFVPFGGQDARPAPLAGSVIQLMLQAMHGSKERVVEIQVEE